MNKGDRGRLAEMNKFSTDNYSKSSLDFVYNNISIEDGIPIYDFQYYGAIKDNDIKSLEMSQFLESFGFLLQSSFFEEKSLSEEYEPFEDYRFSGCYISEQGYCKVERRINTDTNHTLYFDVTCAIGYVRKTNFIQKFMDKFCQSEKPSTKEKNNSVYTLSVGQSGYKIIELGRIGRTFIHENYTKSVSTAFNKLTENIKAKNPFGRLSILTGTPGTGKTFFIKGLIEECPGVKFVMVDPNIMLGIGGPSLVEVFLGAANAELPTVLCIEDADNCLVERMSDNVSYISGLLNLTDGIYGESLNLHVIASTNQSKLEIDPALLRPGRMHALIEFEKLSKDEAEKIFERELGEVVEFESKDSIKSKKREKKIGLVPESETKEFTIAEIYNKICSNSKYKKEEVEPLKPPKVYTREDFLF